SSGGIEMLATKANFSFRGCAAAPNRRLYRLLSDSEVESVPKCGLTIQVTGPSCPTIGMSIDWKPSKISRHLR
ncbi:unnamed protein product, partial [Nesidiocoris tenuis]